jgi:hypothetical protein
MWLVHVAWSAPDAVGFVPEVVPGLGAHVKGVKALPLPRLQAGTLSHAAPGFG